MTAQININDYQITYDENHRGGIKLLEVFKANRDITGKMDTALEVKLIAEIKEALEENQQAQEWAARQDYLDEIENL